MLLTMTRNSLQVPEKGFFYHNPKHKYYMDGVLMTGITTVLKVAGDASNLIQWAANQAAARAIMEGASIDQEAFAKKLSSFKKLDTTAAKELDKLYPGFKAARTAHLQVRDTAADTGKEGHSLCEEFERKQMGVAHLAASDFPPAAVERAKPYFKWYHENVAKTWFVERPLFSTDKSIFVAGTPDGGFQLKDGRNLINDKKFKDYIYDPSPFWQMAAYRFMLEQMASDTTTPVAIDWGGGRTEQYASPREYLASFNNVKWDGAVVLRVGTRDFETMFCDTYEEDLAGFKAALTLYRQIGAFKSQTMEIVE